MAKAKNKTMPTSFTADEYLANIEDEARRNDCQKILDMMQEISGDAPKIWGASLKSGIVGFGSYHYKYESGREGDALRLGFSSRAANISIYIMPGYQDFEDELSRLGKHKIGKACLYIKRLSDVDEGVLKEIMQKGLDQMAEKYPL